jgi:hypothetical protein
LPGVTRDVRKLVRRRSDLLFVIEEIAMLEDTVLKGPGRKSKKDGRDIETILFGSGT